MISLRSILFSEHSVHLFFIGGIGIGYFLFLLKNIFTTSPKRFAFHVPLVIAGMLIGLLLFHATPVCTLIMADHQKGSQEQHVCCMPQAAHLVSIVRVIQGITLTGRISEETVIHPHRLFISSVANRSPPHSG
jgi:hypothetical protein